ncbi:PEPxxWA-CTERM sorting domain-containing protein [uncultured Sphingomonas sp.]|uniref:PEPxxWA-CTERM sorting domain-containing protein n=1 Tax=uncultured Sphingomonas sp. TaxID=158754 RepID=UPI0035C94AB8
MKIIKAVTAAALATTILAAAPAHAATTAYTSEAAFRAAITGATDYAFPFDGMTPVTPSYTLGPVTFMGPVRGYNDGAFGAGVPYLYSQATLRISSTASAVGFFLGSYYGARTIGYGFGEATGSFAVPGRPDSAFIGFVNTTGTVAGTFTTDDELDTIRFVTGNAGAVPEPASWALMILGFGAVGGVMRRRGKVDTRVSYTG